MLPVVLFSLLVSVSLGYEPQPELPKKVVHIPIPKAVTHGKPLRVDQAFDHHQEVPIKKTEVRRVVQRVPLIHEVPIFIQKNKPFYTPEVRPRPIVVHEVVGLPVIRDKHVIQPVYIDRPYIVERKQFVDQPYPVEKPVPIDFVKRITKIYDRKVEVPHIVNVPLVQTVDKPRPVPYTREVVQHYDVHVNVPRPRPIKVTRHRTHVEKVPFETPNVVIRKNPVHHAVNEFIPQVPQGIHGSVIAGSRADAEITREANNFGPRSGGRTISVVRGPAGPAIGPGIAPGPRVLNEDVRDGITGGPADGPRGAREGPARVAGVSAGRTGRPFFLDQQIDDRGGFAIGFGGGVGGGGGGGAFAFRGGAGGPRFGGPGFGFGGGAGGGAGGFRFIGGAGGGGGGHFVGGGSGGFGFGGGAGYGPGRNDYEYVVEVPVGGGGGGGAVGGGGGGSTVVVAGGSGSSGGGGGKKS